MKSILTLACLVFLVIHGSYAPPVSPDNKEHEQNDNLDEFIEYQRYLKEVVQALESDPDFRDRLEKANEEDVRSGKIAEQLDFVHHNVRTKLDEIKRRELERLRNLASKQFEITNNLDTGSYVAVPNEQHLDESNPHTFEIEDLRRLIKKTTADLEEADRKRREEFKEYEMQKEFDKHQKLENLDETHKAEYEAQLKKEEEEKKKHKPLHHPGSKQQLEEVWEKQDHMDQQFDPKAFFMMHDVDGNGVWDADEVKALFIKELDKIYTPNGPNKDLHERAEEMERMREHVFNENDRNRDGLIDFNEFMMETQRADFNQDEGWKPIDENQIYSQSEYQEYEQRKMQELRYLQYLGLVDAHGRPVPGKEHEMHKAVQHFQAQYHPGQYPPQYAQPGQQGFNPQAAQGQFQLHPQHQGQLPGQFQGHVPQGQFQGQVPQGQAQQGQFQGQVQPPQGQFQGQAQVPQGQFQGQAQVPQGQFQGQAQVPQGQFQGQAQVPQGQAPQGQFQGQAQVPQGQFQGQPQVPQGQFQGQAQIPQGQFQGQAQVPQGQAQVPQGQFQGQVAQGQGQVPAQGQQPQHASQGQAQPIDSQAQAPSSQSQAPPSVQGGHH